MFVFVCKNKTTNMKMKMKFEKHQNEIKVIFGFMFSKTFFYGCNLSGNIFGYSV